MIRSIALALTMTLACSHALMAEEEKPPTAAHGGIPRLVGDDVVELVQDASGKLTVYISGEDQKPYAVEAKPLTAQVKVPGASSLLTIMLQPLPQAGDPAGKASVFAGTDGTLAGKTGTTVILKIELDEKMQRVVFAPGKN